MPEPEATFALIAELALGLAGFGGVAAAFGGVDRAYAPVELTRLRALFMHASLTLANSLFVISLLWFGLALASAAFWACAMGAVAQAPVAAYLSLHAYRYAADGETTTSWFAFWVTCVPTWLAVALFAAGAGAGGSMGFLVSALSVQLLLGVWVFTRVLTRRN